jgi:hypothetical protein
MAAMLRGVHLAKCAANNGDFLSVMRRARQPRFNPPFARVRSAARKADIAAVNAMPRKLLG